MPGVVLLDVSELVENRDVAEPAEEHAAVGQLLPVIEALARVVRFVVEGRGRWAHSRSPGRASARSASMSSGTRPCPSPSRSRRSPARHRAKRRRRHGRVHGSRLPACAASAARRRTQRAGCSAPSPACRMPPWKRACEHAGQIVDPLRSDSVLTQRLVLTANLLALLLVCGETEAGGPAQRVSRQLFHAVERALRPPPHAQCGWSRPYVSRATS